MGHILAVFHSVHLWPKGLSRLAVIAFAHSGILTLLVLNPMADSGKTRCPAPADDKMTWIYLVRHGQTFWNADKRLQGNTDSQLNGLGLAQATAAGKWLAGDPVIHPDTHGVRASRTPFDLLIPLSWELCLPFPPPLRPARALFVCVCLSFQLAR